MNHNGPAQAAALFAPLTAQGWRVAVAGSGQYAGEGMAVWNDRDQADAELRQWAQDVGGAPVWAGLSAGGAAALRNVLTGAVTARGVLAVVPSVGPHPDWCPEVPAQVPVAVVVGEQDPLAAGARQFADLLQDRGVPVRVWAHAGGHDVPPHWADVLREATEWIMGAPG